MKSRSGLRIGSATSSGSPGREMTTTSTTSGQQKERGESRAKLKAAKAKASQKVHVGHVEASTFSANAHKAKAKAEKAIQSALRGRHGGQVHFQAQRLPNGTHGFLSHGKARANEKVQQATKARAKEAKAKAKAKATTTTAMVSSKYGHLKVSGRLLRRLGAHRSAMCTRTTPSTSQMVLCTSMLSGTAPTQTRPSGEGCPASRKLLRHTTMPTSSP